MTTVSRTNQVTRSSVTGGGDFDHRLNRLLEDLQETVVPLDSGSGGTEYREYRTTSSTRTNDEPIMTTDEKWIEYGSRGGGTGATPPRGYTSSASKTASEKRIDYSSPGRPGSRDKPYGIDPGLRPDFSSRPSGGGQIDYFTPSNTTTVIQSGPSTPAQPPCTWQPSPSPKVERKEFYSKASYTTLIKGGTDGGPITISEPDFQPIRSDSELYRSGPITNTSETRRELYSHESRRSPAPPRYIEAQPPIQTSSYSSSSRTTTLDDRHATPPPQTIHSSTYSSTSRTTEMDKRHVTPPPPQPIQSASYNSTSRTTTVDNRSMTPPPPSRPTQEGLKTPPLVRKIMQSSQSNYSKEVRTTESRPPPMTYDDNRPPQYFTSTTTRTETREREPSPVRRFPSPQPPKAGYGEPPRRLDDLLATFDESYTETSKISGDGGGPWKSYPYGPGTQPTVRSVRIDDNTQTRRIAEEEAEALVQKPTKTVVETTPIQGPPVFYPPGEIFKKTEEEALMAQQAGGKGKAKMSMDRKYSAGEKSKSSHKESGGQGAAPVPVCLPICCAAPCVIM